MAFVAAIGAAIGYGLVRGYGHVNETPVARLVVPGAICGGVLLAMIWFPFALGAHEKDRRRLAVFAMLEKVTPYESTVAEGIVLNFLRKCITADGHTGFVRIISIAGECSLTMREARAATAALVWRGIVEKRPGAQSMGYSDDDAGVRLAKGGMGGARRPGGPSQRASGEIHHYGDVIVSGSKYNSTITSSTVGAVAVGDHAVATGTVNIHQGALTQAQHLEHIKAAKKALVDDEERLDAAVHEALARFLKLAGEVKVEPKAIDEVQDELEGILDRVWTERKALPQGLEVAKALAKSPAMDGVTKKLLGT
jgi:hypothetical protein